ncbi:MAG: alpha-amylase family glycosyl hydrolase [Corallococcus sp.]|nr:alpha-amylase family glycosyl hydrolase [Corallococcus sp.]
MRKSAVLKLVSVVLVSALMLTLLASCNGRKEQIMEYEATTDNYRTYYQIFPYSFADSDGDGIGDINGIIDKLDYIADMNFEGIWLTPIHQSPSYHKYDVVDYKSIDSKFGTLEDYDRLVEECHNRGMTVLLDLVFNHSAKTNKWFEACYAAHMRNKPYDTYYNFYRFEQFTGGTVPTGWAKYNSNWIYEAQFNEGMPDLNLQNVLDEPEGYLATELKSIMEFWLVDHDVDGFRLDAVTSYFTGNATKNTEFLTWLNDTAKAIKPSCYIVGEGAWSNVVENRTYQSSGVDSFFLFQHGYDGSGTLSFSVRLEKARYLFAIDEENVINVAGGIPAMFISNHDISRAYGILQAGNNVNNLKMGYGLMAMCAGTTFWYYGDEVGMNAFPNSAGKVIDENRRQPMPWGDSYTCRPVNGSTAVADSVKYPLGTVKQNLRDSSSVIDYIARANALRRAFPAIARNYGEKVYLSADGLVAAVKKGSGADAVYIVMNVSHKTTATVNLSEIGSNLTLKGTLSVDDVPTLSENVLTMPKQTFAILQQG